MMVYRFAWPFEYLYIESYIYIYVCIYLCIFMYIYIYVYLCIYIYVYLCIYIYMYIYVYIYICICICICIYLCMYVCIYIYLWWKKHERCTWNRWSMERWEVVEAGTPDYMAPEMIDPPHYHDNSADWWSLGVLMFDTWTQLAQRPQTLWVKPLKSHALKGGAFIYQPFCYFAVNWDARVLTHAHFALTSYVNMVWFFFMKLRRCCANSCVSATTGSWCHKHTRLSHTTLSHRHNILTHNFVTHSTSRTTLSHTQHCPGRALGDTHGMFCQMPCLEHRSPWWSRLSRFFFLLHTAFTTLCHTHTHTTL